MPEYFDRYDKFKKNGAVKPVPGIFLAPKATDKNVLYKQGETRLDKLSQDYYGNPYHGFLIMSANPKFGGLEFLIPDREIIRVPFPFDATLRQYEEEIAKIDRLYGI